MGSSKIIDDWRLPGVKDYTREECIVVAAEAAYVVFCTTTSKQHGDKLLAIPPQRDYLINKVEALFKDMYDELLDDLNKGRE